MWSFKRKDTMMKLYWNTANRTYSRRTLVVGGFAATILLEGEVAEHEDGYRSEKITILGVYSPDNASHRRSLAHHLELPYVKVPRIQDAPNEFPRIYSYT
jgi:hypothetical protein